MFQIFRLRSQVRGDWSPRGILCRFDSEQSQCQEEVQRERTLREKLSREKDMLTGEAFGLRQHLEV